MHRACQLSSLFIVTVGMVMAWAAPLKAGSPREANAGNPYLLVADGPPGSTWQLPANADTESDDDNSAALLAWIQEQTKAGFQITSVGGFAPNWRVVMSKNSGLRDQKILITAKYAPFPNKKIDENRKAGRVVTAMAGSGELSGWFVVLSAGSKLTDQHFSDAGEYPITFAHDFDETYQISSIAGLNNNWVVCVSRGMPAERRRQFVEGPRAVSFDELDKGRRDLPDLNYDFVAGASGSPEQWVVAFAVYETEGYQSRAGPGRFPIDYIRERWSKGLRIISIAGIPGNWVVILQSKTALGDQAVW